MAQLATLLAAVRAEAPLSEVVLELKTLDLRRLLVPELRQFATYFSLDPNRPKPQLIVALTTYLDEWWDEEAAEGDFGEFDDVNEEEQEFEEDAGAEFTAAEQRILDEPSFLPSIPHYLLADDERPLSQDLRVTERASIERLRALRRYSEGDLRDYLGAQALSSQVERQLWSAEVFDFDPELPVYQLPEDCSLRNLLISTQPNTRIRAQRLGSMNTACVVYPELPQEVDLEYFYNTNFFLAATVEAPRSLSVTSQALDPVTAAVLGTTVGSVGRYLALLHFTYAQLRQELLPQNLQPVPDDPLVAWLYAEFYAA